MSTTAAIQAHRPHCTVCLVEDEDDLRRNLKVLLEMRGFQVQACASASEFYREFAVRPSTTVVLDIGLEGEDGLSICDHLRTHNPLLGIVMLTARGMQDDRVKGLLKGADAYLVKPVELDELVIILNRLDARFQAAKPQPAAANAVPVTVPMSLDITLPPPASSNVLLEPSLRSAPIASAPIADGGSAPLWRFELATSVLTAPNGKTRRLVGNERTVVYCMAQRANHPTSVEELSIHLMIPNTPDGKRRVEVILSRLRRNVEAATDLALPLYLLRGTGYFLRDLVLDEARPTAPARLGVAG